MNEQYLVVIDTDMSAHGFFKQMCAYITGIDLDGRYSREVETAKKDDPVLNDFLEKMVLKENPATPYPNPRYGRDKEGFEAKLSDDIREKFNLPAYRSVAIYFHDKPFDNIAKALEKRAKAFCRYKRKGDVMSRMSINIQGYRIKKKETIS